MAGGALGGDGGIQAGGLALRGVVDTQSPSQGVIAGGLLVLPTDGDLVITQPIGTTLNGIQYSGWRPGYRVTLFLQPAVTVNHLFVVGAGFAPIFLRGVAAVGPTGGVRVLPLRLVNSSAPGIGGLPTPAVWFEEGFAP